MGISYSALRDADFAVLASVGEQWLAQAGRLEEREADLDDLRRKRLGDDHWSGTVAEEARAVIKVIGDDTVERAIECRRVARAIDDAVSIFKARQSELDELVAVLPSGFKIGSDGVVVAIGDTVDDGGVAEDLNARIAEILTAVAEADEALHAAVASVAGTASSQEQVELSSGVALADDFQDLLASGADPAAVNSWWDGLSPFEQQGLLDAHPELLAQVDGIPTEVRDDANRTLLDGEINRRESEIEALQDRLAADPDDADLKERLEHLQGKQDDLTNLRDEINKPYQLPDGGPELDHYLLGYSSTDDGRAIVSVGNPDTADHVNVFVPGTGSELGKLDGDLNRTEMMAGDAHRFSPGSETASIMWLGYDAPDDIVPDAMDTKYAEGAASDLSSFTHGLRATAEGGPANLTVTGHSYGSTTIGVAARDASLNVDNLVFVGSPGVGVQHASELGIDPDNVWATRNEEDIIGWAREDTVGGVLGGLGGGLLGGLGGGLAGAAAGFLGSDHDDLVHGTDPTADAFGGRTFASEATRDADGWGELWKDNIANHSAYWDEGNVSRDNMALIVTGQAEEVG